MRAALSDEGGWTEMESTERDDRLAALEERVRLLEDHVAILRLMNSWGPANDISDGEAAAALWAEDGVLDSDLNQLEGPGEIFAMVVSERHRALNKEGSAHVQSFPLITVDGDLATAVGYSHRYGYRDGAHLIRRVSANVWEFRRTSAGWRISRRLNQVLDGGEGAERARRLLGRAFEAGNLC
jgi:hypothetical protein